MSWIGELEAKRQAIAKEQSAKASDAKKPMLELLRGLRGRPGAYGTEWVTSAEIADRLGLTPADRLRPVMRKAHDVMRSLGWKPAQVGLRGLRRRGFVRPIPLATPVPASPHHGKAVEAFRATLEQLATYELNSAQLDNAYGEAKSMK